MRIQRIYNNTDTAEIDGEVDLSLIMPLINKFKGKRGSLIPILQGVQNTYGYIPRVAFELLAKETGLTLSDMYGVATFYAQFRLKPVGKIVVKVCHGTACHVQGADAISTAIKDALGVEDGGTTPDRLFTLETVACLGCCSLAPVMMIGDDTFGKLTGSSAVKIIKEIKIRESQNK
jgi:NADH-quinone oxidoreductase subunit E